MQNDPRQWAASVAEEPGVRRGVEVGGWPAWPSPAELPGLHAATGREVAVQSRLRGLARVARPPQRLPQGQSHSRTDPLRTHAGMSLSSKTLH